MNERKRQEVTSSFAEPWKPEKPGDFIEGTYLGYTKVPSPRKGQAPFNSYNIKTDDDRFIGVSGAMVGSRLARVPKGTYVWITFIGTVKTSNGLAKDFKVECEEGTTLLDPTTEGTEHDVPF